MRKPRDASPSRNLGYEIHILHMKEDMYISGVSRAMHYRTFYFYRKENKFPISLALLLFVIAPKLL